MVLMNWTIIPFYLNGISLQTMPLVIDISILEEIIQTSKLAISPNSEQETKFIKDVISNFNKLDTSNIEDIDELDQIVNQLSVIVEQMWFKNAKKSRFSKHSKQWWLESCRNTLSTYRSERSRENWKSFKLVVKNAKQTFFDDKIHEIANKS